MRNAATNKDLSETISRIFLKDATTDIGTAKHKMNCQYHHLPENKNLTELRYQGEHLVNSCPLFADMAELKCYLMNKECRKGIG